MISYLTAGMQLQLFKKYFIHLAEVYSYPDKKYNFGLLIFTYFDLFVNQGIVLVVEPERSDAEDSQVVLVANSQTLDVVGERVL